MPGHVVDTRGSRRRLWVMGAVILTALALAVVSLGGTQGGELGLLSRISHDAKLIGLLGLVLLFMAYVFGEERRLARKEAELQKLMVREVSLRARLAELTELLDATTEVAQTLDLHAVLGLAARRVLSGLEAEQSAILLLNGRTRQLEGAAAAGADSERVRAARVPTGDGVAGYVQTSGEAIVVETDEMRQRLARELGLQAAPSSALCVPLRFQGTVLGVFCVCRGAGGEAFSPAHARMLQPLAEHCAAAIVKGVHYRNGGGTGSKAA